MTKRRGPRFRATVVVGARPDAAAPAAAPAAGVDESRPPTPPDAEFDPHARWTALDIAIAALALVAAYALKSFYSTANADDLVWILGPTVSLVEMGTGTPFVMEAGEGYLSQELNLLVAPSCAGVNFLIAALCTGALGLSRTVVTARGKVAVALGVCVAAYLLTVFANALRLLVGLSMGSAGSLGTLDPDQLHRVEGVAVYFTVLCVSYLVAHGLLSRGTLHRATAGDPATSGGPATGGPTTGGTAPGAVAPRRPHTARPTRTTSPPTETARA